MHERLECSCVTIKGSFDEELVTDETQRIGRIPLALEWRHPTLLENFLVTDVPSGVSYL